MRESWELNAAAWTRAVRGKRIPSRGAGTDAAVVEACVSHLGAVPRSAPGTRPRVLDVGCGEGWLARVLAEWGAEVHGVDGSEALVAAAAESAVPHTSFAVASYERLLRDSACAAGPWELAVFNFAILGDPVAPLLRAVARRLTPEGRLLIQTVHPWTAAGDGPYRDEWRVERFASFDEAFPASMPWFARTIGSWVAELRAAELELLQLGEPLHPETGRPLSLLLACAPRPPHEAERGS